MTTQTIHNRFTQAVIFSCEAATLRKAVEKAVAEGVSLAEADLSGANLCRADLNGANLIRVTGAELAIARTRILPDEGDIIGWKKCAGEKIVKLLIPDGTKRSNAFGRKCRAQNAKVIEVFNPDGTTSAFAVSKYDCHFTYRVGETVSVPNFSNNWQEECAPGIHFFITRIEAEDYQ